MSWLLTNILILCLWFLFLLVLKWIADWWIVKQYPHLNKKEDSLKSTNKNDFLAKQLYLYI